MRLPQGFQSDMRKNYRKAVVNGLLLWVPMQWINFRYVPLKWRILFIDIVHFFWCHAPLPQRIASCRAWRPAFRGLTGASNRRDIYLCMLTMGKNSKSVAYASE